MKNAPSFFLLLKVDQQTLLRYRKNFLNWFLCSYTVYRVYGCNIYLNTRAEKNWDLVRNF